jgi:hypothetical protein
VDLPSQHVAILYSKLASSSSETTHLPGIPENSTSGAGFLKGQSQRLFVRELLKMCALRGCGAAGAKQRQADYILLLG